MTKYARVANDIVAEIINLDDSVKIDDVYFPSIAATIFACGKDVSEGWIYAGGNFSAPVVPTVPPPTTIELSAYASMRRYMVETGGIVIDGSSISTDRVSQSLITGAYNYVQANPKITIHFKTAAGFVELTAAQMTTIANAVGAHVQAAFTTESAVVLAIMDGTIRTFADIDAASWPSNG
jgi:hypothetical protein